MKKIVQFVKRIVIVLLALVICGAIGFKIYTSMFYRADAETISFIENKLDTQVNSYSDQNGMVFIPENQDFKAVIVFYPGGKVEYSAYKGLLYEIASRGYICLLPKMPENLAFFRINAAEVITSNYKSETETVKDLEWYLAGHSLGGVAASLYIEDTTDDYAGLILCASYPNADLSDNDIRMLSILGSEDGVINSEGYESSKTSWPSDSEEHIIEGGIHSYFGSYGIQKGDGTPSITNEEQLKKTADIIEEWIDG